LVPRKEKGPGKHPEPFNFLLKMQLDLRGIPLRFGLFDLVFEDRHLRPPLYGVGGNPPTEADPVLGNAKPMAPESMALGQRAAQNGILRYPSPITPDNASFCHLFVLPSLNQTK
jgi:hypothetical protein